MNKLLLSKDVYEISIIEQTISAFSELVSICVCDSENYYVCVFENCVYSQDQTIKEFENYLINLCNKMKH